MIGQETSLIVPDLLNLLTPKTFLVRQHDSSQLLLSILIHFSASNLTSRSRISLLMSPGCYLSFFSIIINSYLVSDSTLTTHNLMFDTRLTKPQYDKLNSAMSTRFWTYMATMTTFHTLSFAYLCYFFRYRRLSVLPWAVVSVFYAFYFGITNKICYKVIVNCKIFYYLIFYLLLFIHLKLRLHY